VTKDEGEPLLPVGYHEGKKAGGPV